MKKKLNELRIFYLKNIAKREYFTITIDGKIASYVFIKYKNI